MVWWIPYLHIYLARGRGGAVGGAVPARQLLARRAEEESPPLNRMTDGCENITFLRTCLVCNKADGNCTWTLNELSRKFHKVYVLRHYAIITTTCEWKWPFLCSTLIYFWKIVNSIHLKFPLLIQLHILTLKTLFFSVESSYDNNEYEKGYFIFLELKQHSMISSKITKMIVLAYIFSSEVNFSVVCSQEYYLAGTKSSFLSKLD